MRVSWVLLLVALVAPASAARRNVYTIPPGPDAAARLVARLVDVVPGDVIVLSAGTYALDRELNITCPNVTLRGAGPTRTVLSFKDQQAGSDGIVASGNALVIEDLAVEDTTGNAIKVLGADGVTLRRVRTEWTGGPREVNGPYGIYPVQCRNVLIEECASIGASDAGIYVGQSDGVVVRRCRAERNVAGIEIENSTRADVYANTCVDNTGGLLIFDLPNLQVPRGGGIRVFGNTVQRNNTASFATAGTLVAGVPTGTGVMVMATDRVEIFDNDIADNQTANVAVVSFHVTERTFTDPSYDPFPEEVYVHGNRFKGGGDRPGGKIGMALAVALGLPFPDILYDGVVAPGKTAARALALGDNGGATFANVRLADFSPTALLTGSYRPERDTAGYTRIGTSPPPVVLAPHRAPRSGGNRAVEVYRAAPRQLSGWRLFEGDGHTQQPRQGVLPYDLNTALFSDHSVKHRFIRLPSKRAMGYREEAVFEFPVGTVIAKTFAFARDEREPARGERLVETRIEVRRADGWYGFAYLWNDAQTEAELALGGASVTVARVYADGLERTQSYLVPSANQCLTCHAQSGRFEPLGPTARNLNRTRPGGSANQLAEWSASGALKRAPAQRPLLARFDDPASGSVDERARAWLAVNCAHCHNPVGSARTSGLDLTLAQRERVRFGVFKSPVATGRGSGGRHYDIVPGHPDESILAYRLASNEPGVRMPSLARQQSFPEAVALIERWIREMPAKP